MIMLTKTQQEVIDSDARVKLIMGGVRSGKTLTVVKTLEKEMKKLSPKRSTVLICEPTVAFAKEIEREIMFKMENDKVAHKYNNQHWIDTVLGRIEIKCLADLDEIDGSNYDIVVIDHATRNKFFIELFDKYIYGVYGINGNGFAKLIVAGHCPEDAENPFYRMWCLAFYGSLKDIKAFKLKTWDNPQLADKKEESEKELLKRMSLERYIRDYYATII